MNLLLPYWLALLHLPMSLSKIKIGLSHFSDVKALFDASSDELQAIGFHTKDIQSLKNPDWQSVEHALAWRKQSSSHHLISLDDAYYPDLLKEISMPPLVLFVKGNVSILRHKQMAIVGSRHPTSQGLMNAEHFAYALAEAGFAITSGLALGIDGASHKGALLAKGVTIGVAGTGLSHTYPTQHASLYEEIISANGAIISEFPLSMPAKPRNFPRRNRIIAALSIGTLVIEAALKSGSLITARYALEEGREVFAIPGSIHHPQVRGCHYLIRQGAKLVETVADILEEIQGLQQLKFTHCVFKQTETAYQDHQEEKRANLLESEKTLLNEIGYDITPLDMIILRSGLTASELSSMLLVLELKGYIKSIPGGYVRTLSISSRSG